MPWDSAQYWGLGFAMTMAETPAARTSGWSPGAEGELGLAGQRRGLGGHCSHPGLPILGNLSFLRHQAANGGQAVGAQLLDPLPDCAAAACSASFHCSQRPWT